MKKLFLLTTALGDFYIIANSPNKAVDCLNEAFEKADYGFSNKRKVTNIKILGSELGEFPTGKPNFSSGNNLLIDNT